MCLIKLWKRRVGVDGWMDGARVGESCEELPFNQLTSSREWNSNQGGCDCDKKRVKKKSGRRKHPNGNHTKLDGEKKEKEANRLNMKRSSKHEKVNGMVKWNYLGHRRTVDPNKVKGMAKSVAQNHHRRSTCDEKLFRLMDRDHRNEWIGDGNGMERKVRHHQWKWDDTWLASSHVCVCGLRDLFSCAWLTIRSSQSCRFVSMIWLFFLCAMFHLKVTFSRSIARNEEWARRHRIVSSERVYWNLKGRNTRENPKTVLPSVRVCM